MRILVDWLEEFVDLPDRVERLADRLTFIGLEVEETRVPARKIEGIVPARLCAFEPHDSNPELTVCELEAHDSTGRVVTAAQNLREGGTYVWAPPGARLPGGRVESRRFDGMESEGMLCSLQELGLTDRSRRLLELPPDVDRNRSAADLLNLDRPVLELDLTPNRADCLSHLGVARDVAAAEGLPLKTPGAPDLPAEPVDERSIEIEDADGCGAYLGVPVEGITVGPSPLNVQTKLIRLGQPPINNLVDLTNVVLFERGHPLHAFDADRLRFPVTVRRAESGETLTTLDGEKRSLEEDDLVIADDERPRALAGIMGGAATEVRSGTGSTLLEGAYFDPVRVRRTASRLGLSTEASHRFERGTDPEGIEPALARCVQLLRRDPRQDDALAVHRPIRVRPRETTRVRVPFQPGAFRDLIGYSPGERVMRDRLDRLGCEVDVDAKAWTVTVPTWRHDLKRSQDLMEEIVRLDGYRNVVSDHPTLSLDESPAPGTDRPTAVRRILADLGFREAVTFSFVAPDRHRFVRDGEPRRLSNPLSRRRSTLRRSLLDGLTEALCDNLDAGRKDVRLFEVGRVFPPDERREPRRVGLVATGGVYREQWHDGTRRLDYFDVRGCVEFLLERLGYGDIGVDPETLPGFAEHRAARLLVEDRAVGRLGELDRSSLDLETDAPVLGAEVDLSSLPEPGRPRYRPYSSQPVVKRDLDLVVEQDQHAAPLREAIREGTEWLESITLFDLYYGEPLPEDKKSLSFRLRFRRAGKTLSDEDVNRVQEEILDRLRDRFGATLREE